METEKKDASYYWLIFEETNNVTGESVVIKNRYKNGKLHGLIEAMDQSTKTYTITFYREGENITDAIMKDIPDLTNLTEADKTFISLRYGIDCDHSTMMEENER